MSFQRLNAVHDPAITLMGLQPAAPDDAPVDRPLGRS